MSSPSSNSSKKRRLSRRSRRNVEMEPPPRLAIVDLHMEEEANFGFQIDAQLPRVEVDAVPIAISIPVILPIDEERTLTSPPPIQNQGGLGDAIPGPSSALEPAWLDGHRLVVSSASGSESLFPIPRVLVAEDQQPPEEISQTQRLQNMQLIPQHGRHDDHGWQESRVTLIERSSFLLNNPRMSDIKFIVGDTKTEFYGHKTILAMGSPVFEAQFFGCLKSDNVVIELPDFSPDTFLLFLKYLYTDTLDESIDVMSAMHLLRPAKQYIVKHLIERCEDILMSQLKAENVFQVHNYADFFDLPKLSGACTRFIDRETETIVQTEEFTMLNSETLCTFLKRDGLNISEIDLWRAVIRWAEFECERKNIEATDDNVREAIGQNLPLIRFPTMSPPEFAEVARRAVLSAEECKDIFIYACSYQNQMNQVNHELTPRFPATKRNFFPQQYLVSRFGGEPTPHSLNYRSGEIYTYRYNIKADRQIFFKGVNIFSIRCGVNAQYEQRRFNGAVYLYDAYSSGERGGEKARKQFSRDGSLESELETQAGSRYFPVLLDNEVRIPANQMFTVCAVVSVASSSYQQQPLNTFIHEQQDELREVAVKCADDLVVNFSFSSCSPAETIGKYTSSQIPEIVFSL